MLADDGSVFIFQEEGIGQRFFAVFLAVEEVVLINLVYFRRHLFLIVHVQFIALDGEQGIPDEVALPVKIALRTEAEHAGVILAGFHGACIVIPGEGFPFRIIIEEILPEFRPHLLEDISHLAENGIVAQYGMFLLTFIDPPYVKKKGGGNKDDEGKEDEQDPK